MNELIPSGTLLSSPLSTATLGIGKYLWPKMNQDETVFVFHVGLFRYKRMPFGFCNASATFQRTLDILLSPFRWRSCLVCLDDVIIFSRNIE